MAKWAESRTPSAIPAYEAASEFIGQVAGNLDDLLEKASGEKQALNTLERLEQRRDETMKKLQKLMQQFAEAVYPVGIVAVADV